MLTTLIEGFILGISTGTLCLVTCTPIYIPYLMSEDRKFGRNFIKVFEISAGRFFSYIAFGALAGFLGGILSILLILGIARITRSYSVYTILMSGVAINFFFSAFILLLQYMVDITQTISVLRWLMGSISTSGYKDILILLPIWIFFMATAILLNKELVLISGGENFAATRGLDVKKFRILLFIIVSLITGVIVSITGPIGFIGLIVPHIARQFVKDDFRFLVIVTVIFGGILLAVADLLARTLIPPAEIPVGVITSFFGAPFFLFILITSLRKKI